MKIETLGNLDYDPYEVAQTISYPTNRTIRKMCRIYTKQSGWCKFAKKYKLRRQAVKRGELGWKACYGNYGHSSYWW